MWVGNGGLSNHPVIKRGRNKKKTESVPGPKEKRLTPLGRFWVIGKNPPKAIEKIHVGRSRGKRLRLKKTWGKKVSPGNVN